MTRPIDHVTCYVFVFLENEKGLSNYNARNFSSRISLIYRDQIT